MSQNDDEEPETSCCKSCCCCKKSSKHDSEDDEHVPCWKCCCPRKKSEIEVYRATKDRRQSVAVAAVHKDKIKSIAVATEAESEVTNVLPIHLPLTFVPDFIIYQIFEKDAFTELPAAVTSDVVLLVADVSGFTSLCESFCQKGATGIEQLTNVLNGFMSALSALLIEGGGDILNFAGDAFLVQWVQEDDSDESIENAAIKAYECATTLQTHQCLLQRNSDGKLKIKIGIAIGEVSIWTLGSKEEFLLFVAAGPALPRVQNAEGLCLPGDIVVDQRVYQILKGDANFKPVELTNGYVKVTEYPPSKRTTEPEPDRMHLFDKCRLDHIAKAQLFLIPGLRSLKSAKELHYVSELTTVTVLFVALLEVNVAQPQVLDETFQIILESVKMYEGVLNKMLLFDKGCTFLLAFGLPGLKHANDAARGIYCAEEIIDRLQEINIKASIGISSGTCYCGIVGHPQRQEYTVIGNRVNMAARIMVIYNDQPIALNVETYHLSRDEIGDICFVQLPTRKMKGIESAGAIYAYRKHLQSAKKQSITTFDIVEDRNLYGSDVIKLKIKQCLTAMSDEHQREEMKKKNLLPIIVVKGHPESGKSYLSYFTVDCALAAGYKFAACCAISSYQHEPFAVITQIIRRMLNMTMYESSIDRENILMHHLRSTDYHNLYLLNHFFNCEFPIPDTVITNLDYMNEKIMQFFKTIVHKFCDNKCTLICVDNADCIDPDSWTVFLHLAEEEKVLLLFNLSIYFKEVDQSSSAILLKAYLHINTDSVQEDIFAPVLCWYLRVHAVHKKLFLYLKEITGSKIPLLKEISLSAAIFRIIDLIPLDSIDEEILEKDFFVDRFEFIKPNKPMACDLKPGLDLKKALIPRNVNDAVTESMNHLTIQDRLLLKRAAILGADFDLHSLESVSTGMRRHEVLESVSNLLSNHIFCSACTLENRIEVVFTSAPTVTIDSINVCFCNSVYMKTLLKQMDGSHWPIGPYHRLQFRTYVFRTSILSNMTKEQIYSMRIEAADNLETSSTECSTCRSSRMEGIAGASDRSTHRYSSVFRDCICLASRPRIYSQISSLYYTLGLIFLPIYFKRKAAQAANELNYPVQALSYIKMISKKLPQYWLISTEDKAEEEAYFDPLVLDVSLQKTIAEAFLKLGHAYHAVSFACKGLEMLGIDFICFYGAYKPKDFKHILPKFKLLYAEYITKLVGVLAKAHVLAHEYDAARNLLQIEYLALKLFPIDFTQILSNMTTMYRFKYLVNETETLQELEKNIVTHCKKRILSYESLVRLSEIAAIGNSYAIITETNFALGKIENAQYVASEAMKILQLGNYKGNLPFIKILMSHLHFSIKNYEACSRIAFDLFKSTTVTSSRKYHYLSICCLSMFLTESLYGVQRTEIYFFYDKCNTLASTWRNESSRMLSKDLNFYVSVVMAYWCQYSNGLSGWINAQPVFVECYKLSVMYQKIIDRFQSNYWTISGLLLLLEIQIRSTKKEYGGISVEKEVVQKELDYLKSKVKTHYPLFLEKYKHLVTEAETLE